MRKHYLADWAFSIKGAIQRIVEEKYPKEKNNWPIIKAFNFEAYKLREEFIAFILKDKLSGITKGEDVPKLISLNGQQPQFKPSIKNINEWREYIATALNLKPQDALMILPYQEKGNNIDEDWKSFSHEDQSLWHSQLQEIIKSHFYYIKGFSEYEDFFLPPGYEFLADNCNYFFEDHPNYDKNVFIMTRFEPGNRLLEELNGEVKNVLKTQNLNPLRADDKMYLRDRNLWNNVCVYMNCCKYGIAILEDRIANEFNPNVALEYGFMRALDKPVLLLADSSFRNLRADIIGTLREQFDITDIKGTIEKPIIKWLSELK